MNLVPPFSNPSCSNFSFVNTLALRINAHEIIPVRICPYIHILALHLRIHTYACTYRSENTCTRTNTHAHIHTHFHTHTNTHKHTQTHTHTRAHTHIHIHIHTHTHTHTHTRTRTRTAWTVQEVQKEMQGVVEGWETITTHLKNTHLDLCFVHEVLWANLVFK